MLLITGATGNLGSAVIAQLLKVGALNQFVVTSSNEAGVKKLADRGFNARLANFNDSASLNMAFQGIYTLLLVSTMEQNRFEQHKHVIDAAKAQGVKHVVYTSLAIKDNNTSGVRDLMISHFQTEDYLKESGIAYTILRNTMYADALTQILGTVALTQNINLPGGIGRVPYVLRREMGEGIANLLLQNGHENKIYNITGSQFYGYQEIAETISNLTGTTISYNYISDDDFRSFLKEIDRPDFVIYLHAGTIYDIKTQQYEIVDNTLETLLGRPTASVNDFIKELFLN